MRATKVFIIYDTAFALPLRGRAPDLTRDGERRAVAVLTEQLQLSALRLDTSDKGVGRGMSD